MNNRASDIVLKCQGIHKTFTEGPADVTVLRDISLNINKGEQVAIVGSSGSGKSTLLNIIGLLDVPNSGLVELDGVDMSGLDDTELARIRNAQIGFVFQILFKLKTINVKK